MHILMIAPAFPPFTGGAEVYAGVLAQHLSKLGCQVTVVTSTAKDESDLWLGRGHEIVEELPAENLRLLRCPIQAMPGGWRGLVAWRRAMVLLSALPGSQAGILQHMAQRVPSIQAIGEALASLKSAVDVVHGFNISWENALLQGWQFASSHNIPFVITPFAHLSSRRVALQYVMDHQKKVMSDADVLLAMTSIEVDGLRERGVTPKQTAVIGAGLAALPPGIDGQQILANFKLAKPYVLFIGRTSFDKGAVHAAQAILALREQNVAVDLVLAGRITAEFERFYEGLAVEKQQYLRPMGVFDENRQQELHALLDQSAMLILPSRMDSFGLVILEAWAHGKPVIGARAGGIPGVVDDGKNGILIDFGDVPAIAEAVRLLLVDQSLSKRMGENGREKVRTQYNWDSLTAQMLNIYQSLLQR